MQDEAIFDLGMSNGDDSDFYLQGAELAVLVSLQQWAQRPEWRLPECLGGALSSPILRRPDVPRRNAGPASYRPTQVTRRTCP